MNKRKIIQISADSSENPGIYALADDGTLWLGDWHIRTKGSHQNEFGWDRLLELPQE